MSFQKRNMSRATQDAHNYYCDDLDNLWRYNSGKILDCHLFIIINFQFP